MTEALYLVNSYQKDGEATVTKVDGKYIVLDKTIFYAVGGGQPHDTGTIKRGVDEFKVLFVKKFGDDISHEVDKEGLQVGDTVSCMLDWDRRYTLMRMHSAAHVLAGVLCEGGKASITGGQLNEDRSRFDINCEEYSREWVEDCIKKTNEVIAQDLEIKVYTLPKEEATKDQALFKLEAKEYVEKLPDNIRVVDIVNFDKQADGGTHVKSLKEIGSIKLLKIDNRGKKNRRIYFALT